MFTREELLSSPEYWFEDAQNELYRQVIEYKEKKGINQTQLAEELGVSKGYVSQILKGEFNYTLKTLIDISLARGVVPKIEYKSIAEVIQDDKNTYHLNAETSELLMANKPKFTTTGLMNMNFNQFADNKGHVSTLSAGETSLQAESLSAGEFAFLKMA